MQQQQAASASSFQFQPDAQSWMTFDESQPMQQRVQFTMNSSSLPAVQLTSEQSQSQQQLSQFQIEAASGSGGGTDCNMETIRSCLDVMVEQTHVSAQFSDSINFLQAYPSLTVEYLERLIKREVVAGQTATQTNATSRKVFEFGEKILTRNSSRTFEQKYFTQDSNVYHTNTERLLHDNSAVKESLLELAVVQLAYLVDPLMMQSSQLSQQACVALFLLSQVNKNSSNMPIQQQVGGQSHLDWNCKVDLKKNGERMIQTRPILIDGGQYWAFMIELGNDSLVNKSPISANASQTTRPQRRANDQSEEAPWFKFSVLECCMKIDNNLEAKNCNSDQQPAREGNFKQISGAGGGVDDGLLQRYLSQDGFHSSHVSSRGQLQTKKAKFIKRKSSQTSITRSGSKGQLGTGIYGQSVQQLPSTVDQLYQSSSTSAHQHNSNQIQLFTFELCAEVLDNDGNCQWVTLYIEKILSVKSQRGRPSQLFKLPKRFIQPLVHSDGSLNLKIRFTKEYTLTASAQYLQSKIQQFQQAQASSLGDHHKDPGSLFLYQNVLNGAQLQKLIELLKVPGDLALASVKRLIEGKQQQQSQYNSATTAAAAIPNHNYQSLNINNFQTPLQKRSGSKTPHKVINLSLATKQLPSSQQHHHHQQPNESSNHQDHPQVQSKQQQQQLIIYSSKAHLQANNRIDISLQQSRDRRRDKSYEMFRDINVSSAPPNDAQQQACTSQSRTRSQKLLVETGEAGTQDSSYYHTLLMEKEQEIAKLQTLLEQSHRKNEKVALKILDQPTITHSAKATVRGNTSAYSLKSGKSGMLSPMRDYSICESNSPICLNNVVDDGEDYVNQLQQALFNSNVSQQDSSQPHRVRTNGAQAAQIAPHDESTIVLSQIDQTIQLSPLSKKSDLIALNRLIHEHTKQNTALTTNPYKRKQPVTKQHLTTNSLINKASEVAAAINAQKQYSYNRDVSPTLNNRSINNLSNISKSKRSNGGNTSSSLLLKKQSSRSRDYSSRQRSAGRVGAGAAVGSFSGGYNRFKRNQVKKQSTPVAEKSGEQTKEMQLLALIPSTNSEDTPVLTTTQHQHQHHHARNLSKSVGTTPNNGNPHQVVWSRSKSVNQLGRLRQQKTDSGAKTSSDLEIMQQQVLGLKTQAQTSRKILNSWAQTPVGLTSRGMAPITSRRQPKPNAEEEQVQDIDRQPINIPIMIERGQQTSIMSNYDRKVNFQQSSSNHQISKHQKSVQADLLNSDSVEQLQPQVQVQVQSSMVGIQSHRQEVSSTAQQQDNQLTSSQASFYKIPVTQRIPDEFDYKYGEPCDAETSSNDYIMLKDQEGSSVFDEMRPSIQSLFNHHEAPRQPDTANWREKSPPGQHPVAPKQGDEQVMNDFNNNNNTESPSWTGSKQLSDRQQQQHASRNHAQENSMIPLQSENILQATVIDVCSNLQVPSSIQVQKPGSLANFNKLTARHQYQHSQTSSTFQNLPDFVLMSAGDRLRTNNKTNYQDQQSQQHQQQRLP